MSLYDAGELMALLQSLGYQEPPMAMFYTDQEPTEGFTPKPGDLPTIEKERAGQVDWDQV